MSETNHITPPPTDERSLPAEVRQQLATWREAAYLLACACRDAGLSAATVFAVELPAGTLVAGPVVSKPEAERLIRIEDVKESDHA